MLDKDTKDIDAGVELLLDRKKGVQVWCLFSMVVGAVVSISGAVFEDFAWSVLGIGLLIFSVFFVLFIVEYKLLVQARKIMVCQQNQILLVNEVLNDLDSLEDRLDVRKVKKR